MSPYLLLSMMLANVASAEVINILAVVDSSKTSDMQAMKDAIQVINQDQQLLRGHTLALKVTQATENETIEAIDTVCTDIQSGVHILVDSSSPLVSAAMASLAKRTGLPHISLVTDQLDSQLSSNTVQISAPGFAITSVVRDIVSWENLTNVGILYDDTFDLDNEHMKLLQNIPAQHTYMAMVTERSAIKAQLNNIMDFGLNHLFVLGSSQNAQLYLSEASYKDMISFRYTWYVLTQNLEVPCDSCQVGASFFTLTAVPDQNAVENYIQQVNNLHPDAMITEDNVTVSSASSFDLMFYIGKAIEQVDDLLMAAPDRDCMDEMQLNDTLQMQLKNALMQVTHNGVFTNRLSWSNGVGFFDITIDITAVTTNDSQVYSEQIPQGNWTQIQGLRLQNGRVKIPNVPSVYRVATLEGPPFVFIGTEPPTGVDRYYFNSTSGKYYWGYCIDLVFEIQAKTNFEFTLYESPDGAFGSIQPNGSWDGLVNELIQDRADIVVAPLSVMAERENVIDFTVPYYDLVGISILVQKPQIPYSVFRFMSVLEEPVWGCIFSAFIIVSIMLAVFDKFSPYSYQNNRHIWDGEGEEPRVFSLKEGLWFCMTSLTPQGGGEAPRALSGRLLAATWWMFGFIIIATYTANLAAFLTVSRLETPIESLDDLAKQFKTKYAPEKSTATETYFRRMADIEEKFYHIWKDMSLNDSMDQVERAKLAVWDYPVSDKFTNMWVSMEDSGLPENFTEALDWVKNKKNGEEDFAFLGDATRNKYAMLTDCDLWEVGEEFSRKPYALAVQEGSPLKNQLSSIILQLLNQRILEDLKTTWWEYNKVTCEKLESESDGISIRNIGGVFIVIFIGIGMGLLTLAFEYYWYRWRPQANNQDGATGKQRQQGQENQGFTST